MTRTHTSRTALWVAVIATAVLAACARGPAGPQGETGQTGLPGQTLDWSDTIADANLADSVYAIGLYGPDPWDPEQITFFVVGTGFSAHYDDVIWTNGHVADALQETLDRVAESFPELVDQIDPVAIRSGTRAGGQGTYFLDLGSVLYHPGYDPELEADGNTTPDLAMFRIEASLKDVPRLLPRHMVTQLRVGQPIGTLGLPGELQELYGMLPLATFKDGTISALRPYSPDEPAITPENSRLLQHNLDLTGGTSGSAIFDHRGFIIAVNFAGYGTVIPVPEPDGMEVVPHLIPMNLGLAIRVDEVWAMVDLIDREEAGPPSTPPGSAYPYDSYQAFPENWNGLTRGPE
ncbi:MAG: serine protease [Spirochaetaceae bacterium]|nr:serine protease [Spirochaetaceae bacterium]